MKIAMVVEHCNKQGGHERVVAELAERIADYHEVHIFANSFDDLENERIITHHVPMFKKPALLMITSFILASTYQLRRQKFDIIHSQGPNAIVQNVITDHTTQRAKINALSDFVSNRRRSLIQSLHDRALQAIIYRIEGMIYNPKSGRRIIAVSNGVRREIVEYYGRPDDEISVIPNGVDLEEFYPGNRRLYRAEIRQQFGISERDFVLLFVGGDWERKGLEYIIRSLPFIGFQSVKLLVVGEWFSRGYFTELSQNSKTSGQIVWIGKSRAVRKFYAASDLLILPSFYEAFSLVMLEAMASGLPLLATRINGAEDLIREGCNGYFVTRDSRDIAQRVELFINNRHLLETMGCCARKTAERYSWDRIAREIMKVYAGVVRTRKN